MAFHFEPDEAVGEGVRRMAVERIDDALARLRGDTDDAPTRAIHESRKRGKELRSLARLVRSSLGSDVFSRENAALRDAGRALSGTRDAQVLVSAFDDLLAAHADYVPAGSYESVRAGLVERADAATAAMGDAGGGVAEAIDGYVGVRGRVPDWPLDGDGFDLLAQGVRRSYGDGRSACRAALEDPSVERLHDWRKRVKDLWYHVRVLSPSAPALLEPLAATLHELSDLLGDDHDLAVLAEVVCADVDAFGGRLDVEGLSLLAAGRRRQLQQEAFALGDVVYVEKPKAFTARLAAYWDAWRDG